MEEGRIKTYKDLLVWQKGVDLVDDLYAVTRKYPKDELFGLISQIRRAAVSIPTNIAEGWGRKSTKNYIQFIRISVGSLYELETLLTISKNQKFIDQKEKTSLSEKIDALGKMLNAILKKLEKHSNEQ
jgi:four helix bundle protein